jgi:glycosyltransferase involved in cell wall biosynthesis
MPVSFPKTSQVAVAIPVYNGADYLVQAVQSAIDQQDEAAEISIVDDASTDETPSVIQSLSGNSAIQFHRLPERVPAPAAWNAAVRTTSASHLVVLAHDDIIEPTFCQEAQHAIDSMPDVDLIAFGHQDLTSDGRLGPVHPMRDSGLPIGVRVDNAIFLDRFCAGGQFFLPSAVVMSRRIFDKIDGFDERLKVAYDWDFYLRVAANGAKIVLHDSVLCRYRLHATQSVQSFTRRDNGDNAIIFEKLSSLKDQLSEHQIRLLVDGMCDFMRNMVSHALRDPGTSADEVMQLLASVTCTLTEWSKSPLQHAVHVSVSPRRFKRRILWEMSKSRAGIGLLRRLLGVRPVNH